MNALYSVAMPMQLIEITTYSVPIEYDIAIGVSRRKWRSNTSVLSANEGTHMTLATYMVDSDSWPYPRQYIPNSTVPIIRVVDGNYGSNPYDSIRSLSSKIVNSTYMSDKNIFDWGYRVKNGNVFLSDYHVHAIIYQANKYYKAHFSS